MSGEGLWYLPTSPDRLRGPERRGRLARWPRPVGTGSELLRFTPSARSDTRVFNNAAIPLHGTPDPNKRKLQA
jgi:hypothetical protein